MSYPNLSGGRRALVDRLGSVGVSGWTPTGSDVFGVIAGLLGGVMNDGELGEAGGLGLSANLGVDGLDTGAGNNGKSADIDSGSVGELTVSGVY